MRAVLAFGACCLAAARALVFAAAFQRPAQAVGVFGFGGGPLVVTPTPEIVVGGLVV
jgi:hypothetical protein